MTMEVILMSEQKLSTEKVSRTQAEKDVAGALLLGTGLALVSFIILPAVASRIGLGPSLTGAMRMALMKASAKASSGGSRDGADACTTSVSCH